MDYSITIRRKGGSKVGEGPNSANFRRRFVRIFQIFLFFIFGYQDVVIRAFSQPPWISLTTRRMQQSNGLSVEKFSGAMKPTSLFARKVKRGSLGSIASSEDGKVSSVSSRKSKMDTSNTASSTNNRDTKKEKSGKKNTSIISPALAEWMSSQEESFSMSSEEADTGDVSANDDDGEEIPLESFSSSSIEDTNTKQTRDKSNKSRRRQNQSLRMEEENQRSMEIEQIVNDLQSILKEKASDNPINDILMNVQKLFDLSSSSPTTTNLRQLFGGKQRYDYRLLWVGSDDAICHIGTGLHKVPLARLQEIFMSCLGRNQIEILEVIRILGPFPNVKNTLQGTIKTNKNENNDIGIVMDTMIDGTGKEIPAGTDDNVRRVNLQIEFCDERVIVAIVPSTEEKRLNPLEENGKHVLIFVKEDKLEEQLDALRVS